MNQTKSLFIKYSSNRFTLKNLFQSSFRSIASVAIQPHQLPGDKTPLGKYGGRHTVTVLPGDGIGPEMVSHLERIFRFANVPVDFEEVPLTTDSGQDDFEHALVSVKRNGVALKGNIETQFDDPSFTSRNVELRRRLDLFANVLHCSSIPTIRSKHQNIDIVLIRENTEGEYSGLEHEAVHGVVESIKIITRYNIERIARFAFEYALLNNRKRVTCIHKANIQKLGDGLFLQVCREMASREYPSIQLDSMIVDNASMQLVSKPQQFDVMLMPNLYGNIISNIACGLVGGPGLVSGINIGCKYAVFETGTRNTGKELAGKDLANPTAFLCAGVDMLRYLHLQQHADLISNALFKSLTEQRMHTHDVGGEKKCSEVIDSVISNIDENMEHFD